MAEEQSEGHRAHATKKRERCSEMLRREDAMVRRWVFLIVLTGIGGAGGAFAADRYGGDSDWRKGGDTERMCAERQER